MKKHMRDKMTFLVVVMLAGMLLLIAGMIIGDKYEEKYDRIEEEYDVD